MYQSNPTAMSTNNNSVINSLTQTMNNLLDSIHNRYCELKIMECSSGSTPVLSLTKSKTFSKFFSKTVPQDTELNLLENRYLALQQGKLAIGEACNLSTGSSGKKRLATLLDSLKNATSIQDILTNIYHSGCLHGNNFPQTIVPEILKMHYLTKNGQPVCSVYDALKNHKVWLNPTALAKLICREAAGLVDSNQEHTIQQIFNYVARNKFDGNPELFDSVQKYIQEQEQEALAEAQVLSWF